MPDLKIKVCGQLNNAKEVAALQPDFLGFIYYPKSPRYVGNDTSWMKEISSDIKKVGVFVNEETDIIKEIIKRDELTLIQLHGSETVALCKELSSVIPIIKVFSGDKLPRQKELDAYATHVKYFLFDHRGEKWGGSGKQFDWNTLSDLNISRPFFLSGGIGPEDLDEVDAFNHPAFAGVDLNSKFETEPGTKDIEKLKLFIAGIRDGNEVSSK